MNQDNKVMWLRPKQAIAQYGIPKTSLQVLIDRGVILSKVVPIAEGAKKGIRLISVDSLDAFINQHPAQLQTA